MRFARLGSFFVFLALWLATAAWGEVAVPPLKARVTDLTGTLTDTQRSALESELQSFESRNGSQIAVLMVPTTQPEALEQYSMRVAEAWKLGKKGVDNGLLILVAKNDRKMRIEVGYGLEGVIPDAIAKRIIDDTIAPHFKQGDFSGGLMAGVQRIEGVIEGRPKAASSEDAAPSVPDGDGPQGLPDASAGSMVIDFTGTFSLEQIRVWNKDLDDFYRSGKDPLDAGRAKPVYILVVPTVKPGTMEKYADGVLRTWRNRDNLDTGRSILLLLAKDDGTAYIDVGYSLNERILPGSREKLIAEIEPRLRKGDLSGVTETGIHGIERIIDEAASNKTVNERISDYLSTMPLWLIAIIALIGEAFRYFLRPLLGASVMAGMVGIGAWFISGYDLAITLPAAAITFIVVLVGLLNWLMMFLDGAVSSGGSGGGGGFSGGGGGFGGGGASGSW